MAIGRVGVVGAGLMGGDIAQLAALAGLPVRVLDVDPAAVERARGRIAERTGRLVAAGRMDAGARERALALVSPAADAGELRDCDLVVEAVAERLEVKREVLGRLGRATAPHCLLASNTSGLSITALGQASGRPERTVGLHFFNPATRMPLVEVVRGEGTTDAAVAEATAFARRLGKTPVAVRECPGFLVNRILVRAMAEAYRSAAGSGAAPGAVDAAVTEAGPAPMGPFALGDLIGLDTLESLRADLEAAYGPRYADAGVLAREVAAGRLGRKSGAGFTARGDAPGVADAPARAAAEAFYRSAAEEAAACVAEGVAPAADVELAMSLGAGWRAGPLAAAAGGARA